MSSDAIVVCYSVSLLNYNFCKNRMYFSINPTHVFAMNALKCLQPLYFIKISLKETCLLGYFFTTKKNI